MFEGNETQQMMVDMADRLLAKDNEFEARRQRLAQDMPDNLHLWPAFAEQGLIGALANEQAGGFGGSARDIASLMSLAGKWLVVEPVLHTALVLKALAECGGHQVLVDQLISGEKIAIFAHQEGGDPFAKRSTMAVTKDGEQRITGVKQVIRGGDIADIFLVSASSDHDTGLYLIEKAADGVALEPTRLIDGSSAATLSFDNAPATKLSDDAGPLVERLVGLYLLGLCAEASGAMAAVNEKTFSYLVTRKQFGVPLATFQALQHRAADMHIAAQEAYILTDAAVKRFDHDHEPQAALALASATKAMTDGLARTVAHDAVQLHGGMGVSDELVISHYFKRLAAIRSECGDADNLRSWVSDFAAPLPMGGQEDENIAAFRREVREFVQNNLPEDIANKGRLGLKIDKDDYVRWQKILYEKGWFAAGWPTEFGGGGWDIHRQLVLLQEAALNNAPLIIPYGVSMVGPVLYSFGNDQQRDAHLPGILSNDVWWCQGYSEPGSGSDLASLRTAAVREGDDYIVNGSKMWTTEAHWADWMHCLVRTSKEGKPQAGISFLLIDMDTPGIEIRPIITIDGQHHTNEIFFDNVRVPAENLVGEEGAGWTIAKFLLSNERVAIADTGAKIRLFRQVSDLYEKAVAQGDLSASRRVLIADRLTHAETELATLVAMEEYYVGEWAKGANANGPEASILKIRGTEILQSLSEIAMMIEGPLGAVHDPAHLHLDPHQAPNAAESASMMAHQYLYGRCWSIFGGTNEIQRNIIAGNILR